MKYENVFSAILKDASCKKKMQQNFRSLPLMVCMILGDAF